MKTYTSEDVRRCAKLHYEDPLSAGPAITANEMLGAYAAHLEREEKESKRDPVTEPMICDLVKVGSLTLIFAPLDGYLCAGPDWWAIGCKQPGATVIRRREVVP